MKTRIKQTVLVAVSILLLSAQSFSQSESSSDFQAFIKTTFEKNLGNLENGNNIAPFLRAFSGDLTWVSVTISTNGMISKKARTKSDLRKTVMLSGNTPSLYVKWEITNYNSLKVRENTIIANFDAAVTLYAGDKMVAKGKNIVQVIATPINDTYVISYINILQVADEIYKGKCYVNVEKRAEGNFFVKTYFPTGTNYSEVDYSVIIDGPSQVKQVKLNGEKVSYYWNTANKSISKEKMNGPKLAVASTSEQLVLEVIKIEQSEKCHSLIPTFKKVKN